MSIDNHIRSALPKVAAPRYRIASSKPDSDTDSPNPLMIESRTLGVPVNFRLASHNISRSGILLENHSNKKVPYNVNTLLELIIDPDMNWLQKPVACVAKVIRLNRSPLGREQYGIKIVQMDDSDNQVWDKCFKNLELNARHLLMTGSPPDAGKKNTDH